ncbi:MAG: hypothetical protein ACI9KI_000470, partial [Patiriisocius sp.]
MTFLFACYKLDQLTQFDITYNEEGVIESSVLVDLLFNVYTPDINSNSESAFENNNTH